MSEQPQLIQRSWLQPVLSPEEAAAWERQLFAKDPAAEEQALRKAGASLGAAILHDFNEIQPLPRDPRILILAGKGHNTGDALIAATTLLRTRPRGKIAIIFAFGEAHLRPLAQLVLAELLQDFGEATHLHYLQESASESDVSKILAQLAREVGGAFDLCLDGVLGMNFKPPVRAPVDALLAAVNAAPTVTVRVAVDLPSGTHAELTEGTPCFQPDFTYATGIAKSVLFTPRVTAKAARIRYLDLGFFDEAPALEWDTARPLVVADRCLANLGKPRAASTDKRDYGHLMVIGGSRQMPGAALMNVRAALQAGAGLVTAFVPESIQPAFAAACPEAMWVPCPETPDGHLSKESWFFIEQRIGKAHGLVAGSGLGTSDETAELLGRVLSEYTLPTVLDADALQPEILNCIETDPKEPLILTPHLGEYNRLTGSQTPETVTDVMLRAFAIACGGARLVTCLLKGQVTRVSNGELVANVLAGGPVQARGGSGDLLAGIIGALLVRLGPEKAFDAACIGAHWLGKAAQALARARGENAVRTTEVLEQLHTPLRELRR
ncbi:MAG: NAD(P)H-hydrate dehydratase [Opitutales bacterium]